MADSEQPLKRRVSVNGSLVIPSPVRYALGIYPGDEVLISLEGDAVKVIPARRVEKAKRQEAGRRQHDQAK